jgi:hypothetical protein
MRPLNLALLSFQNQESNTPLLFVNNPVMGSLLEQQKTRQLQIKASCPLPVEKHLPAYLTATPMPEGLEYEFWCLSPTVFGRDRNVNMVSGVGKYTGLGGRGGEGVQGICIYVPTQKRLLRQSLYKPVLPLF